MSVKSIASSQELSSPFYQLNKEFCTKVESYVLNKNGEVKGSYNAWSFLVNGSFSTSKEWKIMYKKSNYSSTGNLLLSSKSQSLHFVTLWETDLKAFHHSNFQIGKANAFDRLRIPFLKSLSRLELMKIYTIKSMEDKPPFLSELISALEDLFLFKEIYKVDFFNGKLKIELRSEDHHFDVLNRLVNVFDFIEYNSGS